MLSIIACEKNWLQAYLKHYFLLFLKMIFFWVGGLCYAPCGILLQGPQSKSVPLAVKVQNPNHWTAREFPSFLLKINADVRF